MGITPDAEQIVACVVKAQSEQPDPFLAWLDEQIENMNEQLGPAACARHTTLSQARRHYKRLKGK
jgi:hypothetical protein